MKQILQVVTLATVTLWATAGLAQSTNEALVTDLIGALRSGNEAAVQALFISETELVRSVMEDAFPDDPKRKASNRQSMEKGGKERLLKALRQGKSEAWAKMTAGNINWSAAQITEFTPAFNRSDGIEKTDWVRVVLAVGEQQFVLKLHQTRKTAEGWRMVFGGKLRGPFAPATDETETNEPEEL